MKTKYLSKAEREKGTTHYLTWATFNGLGFSFLGDTPVYLMAIHFGATNTQLGYISSIIDASGLILLFLPRLLAGSNLVQVHFYAWLVRGLVCLLYGILLFVQGQIAVMIILIVYTLFCASRTFGVAVASPIQQMLATSATTGEIVVKTSNRFQITRFASQFTSFLILSIKQLPGITGYLVLMLLGMITNTISSFHLKKVPCREVVEYHRSSNILAIFVQSMRDRERALTLFVKWHTLSVAIIFSFIIPFLRKIANFPPNVIFLYTLSGTLATIAAGYMLQPFADRVGSKPIITITSFLLAGVALIWSMISPANHWFIFFLLGFVTTFLLGVNGLLASRLELKSIPEKDRISYIAMMYFCSAIVSLATGLFAGKLADLSERIAFHGLNPFGLTFFIAVILAAQNGLLCSLLQDVGSLSVKETANILFSTRNLKSFLDIYQLKITDDPIKRTTILQSIGQSDTPLATSEIKRILKHPLSTEKGDVIESLFDHPRPSLLKSLLSEAADPFSCCRAKAIFALGAYSNPQVEQLLLTLLDDPTATIRSTAAKSLARIGNTTALPTIKTLAADPGLSTRAAMNYFIALSLMDKSGAYLADLFQRIEYREGSMFEQTMFSLAAKMLDFDPPLADLYQEDNIKKYAGFQKLLDEAKQLRPFFDQAATLYGWYARGNYQNIWVWCRNLLEQNTFEGPLSYLRQSIITHDLEMIDKDNTVAVVYFTYQLIK
jgi:hypothetical protein